MPKKPNIIYIVVDQQRCDMLGSYGHPNRQDAEPRPFEGGWNTLQQRLHPDGDMRSRPNIPFYRMRADNPRRYKKRRGQGEQQGESRSFTRNSRAYRLSRRI